VEISIHRTVSKTLTQDNLSLDLELTFELKVVIIIEVYYIKPH